MRLRGGSALLVVMVLVTAPARAQDQQTPQGEMSREEESAGLPDRELTGRDRAVLAGAVDAEQYRVGPGDVLRLHMWGRVSRSLTLPVSPEGVVFLPGAGTLSVDGKSLARVRSEVLAAMGREFRGVSMDLRLSMPRTFRVYLTGQVKAPGPAEATGVHRVADVVERAGLLEEASERHVEVLHRDGTRDVADLILFLGTGDASLNPSVRDGDVIHVPVRTEFVYANGAVARPGRFELGSKDSLVTLLRLAGGSLPGADAERALMVRWVSPFQAESLWFGLSEAHDRRVNPRLREGDRLYVYFVPEFHQQHEVTILGDVARPGVYPIAEGRHRLSDLVSAAGGFLATADLSAVAIHRRNGKTAADPELDRLLRLPRSELTTTEYATLRTRLASMREEYRVDWNRLKRNDQSLDLLLRDGDIVRVDRLVSSIRVDGEVKNPGILAYRPGLRVDDYIQQAGGLTSRASAGNVRVTRAVTGQTLPARTARTLGPGDFVWVPEKHDQTFWERTAPLLTALAQIAAVVIAVNSVK